MLKEFSFHILIRFWTQKGQIKLLVIYKNSYDEKKNGNIMELISTMVFSFERILFMLNIVNPLGVGQRLFFFVKLWSASTLRIIKCIGD
jgi:hypothetical protein